MGSQKARLGVLGGAFNPPQNCHLLLAREAISQLGLAGVLLVVTGRAPHKEIAEDPGAGVRLELTRRAVVGETDTEVSSLEVEREGPSYTYLTLEDLRDRYPDRELVLIMGADVALGLLDVWRRPERVVELARLGIAGRPGIESERVRDVLERLGAADSAEMIDMPGCDISSTMVRERAAAGEPLGELVPEPVAQLITELGLYRG